jgi:hypothetical protein
MRVAVEGRVERAIGVYGVPSDTPWFDEQWEFVSPGTSSCSGSQARQEIVVTR